MNYILVEWPEVQDLMEESWFEEEAILGNSSSYFIPEDKFLNNKYIESRIVELAKNFIVSKKQLAERDKTWENAIPFEGGMCTFEAIIEIKLNNKNVSTFNPLLLKKNY